MDHHISVGVEIAGNGGQDRERIRIKGTEKIADHIDLIAGGCRIKVFDYGSHMRGRSSFRHNGTPLIQNPGLGAQVDGDRLQLRTGGIQADIPSLIDIAVGAGQKIGFVIQGLRFLADQVAVGDMGGKGGDKDKADQPEHQIAKDELGVKRVRHRFTSNLYPIPQTVERDQCSSSLIFSRRRLMCTSTVRVSPMYS